MPEFNTNDQEIYGQLEEIQELARKLGNAILIGRGGPVPNVVGNACFDRRINTEGIIGELEKFRGLVEEVMGKYEARIREIRSSETK